MSEILLDKKDDGEGSAAAVADAPRRHPGNAKIVPPETLLLPFQKKWVEDKARLKIAEKSRQIGWTWATGFSLVMRQSLKDAKHDAWISSRDDLQARLFLEDCKNFATLLSIGADDLGERVIDTTKNSAYVLQFANGKRINSMSSNPDAQAGKRGSRVLDEFALHPDPRKLYSIAYPGITWGGSLEIFSTHRGSANFFNDLIVEIKHKGNPKGFSLHTVTLQTALDQGFLAKLQAKLPPDDSRQAMDEADYFNFIRAGCADEESFQEEFCCNPSDDNAAFLSYELIQSCEYKPGEAWESERRTGDSPKGEFYVGVDVGRDKDLTVIWVVEKLGDMRFTRDVITLDRKAFDEQEDVLYRILEKPGVRRCCIDQTGLGRQFAERAIKRFGQYNVEGIHFTGPVKEELAYPVRAAFEDKTVRIPSDKVIRADLRSIRKETTASGNIRFTGERTKNGHADRFWALALALHAAKTQGGGYWGKVV
jgi:phage FluMu gp28-like protein